MLETLFAVALFLLGVIVDRLFVRGYLSSYMKKKGEDLATHEDIAILVDQVRATTEATKAIEARISDDVWNRQRLWEMKRDVAFQIIETVHAINHRLMQFDAVVRALAKSTGEDIAVFQEKKLEANNALWSEIDTLEHEQVRCQFLGMYPLSVATMEYRKSVADAFSRAATLSTRDYGEVVADVELKLDPIIDAARKGLGISFPPQMPV
ncbi:hypothetical protein [Terriglobus tenax]|uniref:hypothetical protein n=1 Tax=Terriglobus tenax TaxID=1111115 RepID=UPI0021E061DB|nr:hypothetical protein [Terriglobus tenax]